MKRIIISLIFGLAVCQATSQTVDSIPHHHVGYYGPNGGGQMDNVAQMSDGSVLFIHKIGINFGGSTSADVVGNNHYRISRHGGILLDTLFVPDSDPSWYMFAKNPNGDDNIRVGIVHDTASGGSLFQIFPFDSDLNYDTLNEVLVPLSDSLALSYHNGYLINRHNEIALTYSTNDGTAYEKQHFACFGLDGTLKHENTMPKSSIPMSRGYLGFGVFNESPLEYCWYGRHSNTNVSATYFVCYVLDSLFQHKDTFTLGATSSQHPTWRYNFGWDECLLPDGDDFIFGCRYLQGQKSGACLVRYDKQTLDLKDVAFFESKPMLSGNISEFGACPVGLGWDADGSLFFAYNTLCPLMDQGQVAVAKTDADFNVQWQRFCLEPEGYLRSPTVFTVLEDGGVAVGGGIRYRPEVFFLIVNDDYDGMEEQGFIVRPYAYYPNPTRDELHLHYSPDVTPTQIELYDLQGRLVKTQRSSLESLNLQGLAAGTYTMRVTLEGGKVFSDKVVKE